jgi:hypothetical protein
VTALAGRDSITPFFPMARSTSKAPAVEPQQVDRLAEAVEALTHQVRQLGLIMDEIREDLVHAVRNDYLNPAGSQWRPAASWDRETEDGDDDPPAEQEEEPSNDLPPGKPSGQPTLFS